jgi:hypothetical protein
MLFRLHSSSPHHTIDGYFGFDLISALHRSAGQFRRRQQSALAAKQHTRQSANAMLKNFAVASGTVSAKLAATRVVRTALHTPRRSYQH